MTSINNDGMDQYRYSCLIEKEVAYRVAHLLDRSLHQNFLELLVSSPYRLEIIILVKGWHKLIERLSSND